MGTATLLVTGYFLGRRFGEFHHGIVTWVWPSNFTQKNYNDHLSNNSIMEFARRSTRWVVVGY